MKELAREDGISINQFTATAVAEKMSALLTEEFWRSGRGGEAGSGTTLHWRRWRMWSLVAEYEGLTFALVA